MGPGLRCGNSCSSCTYPAGSEEAAYCMLPEFSVHGCRICGWCLCTQVSASRPPLPDNDHAHHHSNIEFCGTRSVAIMSDAAHMLSDVSSFLVALFAAWAAAQPSVAHYTFGYHRAEIMGALVSVLIIWVVTGVLLYEAVQRVINPVAVNGRCKAPTCPYLTPSAPPSLTYTTWRSCPRDTLLSESPLRTHLPHFSCFPLLRSHSTPLALPLA
jgi:hypothetical protein